MSYEIPLSAITAAQERLRGLVRRTPTLLWHPRPRLAGVPDEAQVFLKLEQLQLGGSFKLRGAQNALLLHQEEAGRGVYTASGGNHGIGVAHAARRLGRRATVYLPLTAPVRSEEVLRGLGAEVVRAGAAWDDAWALCERHAKELGALLIHPFDDADIIAGQGTLALELLEDVPDPDLVLVAIGGGGLISGVATVVRARMQGQVVGVEPEGADAMARSLAAGRLVRLPRVTTIAGSLAPLQACERTLSLVRQLCAGVALVRDDELCAAQALLEEDLRLQVEPAGAAALAALCSGRLRPEWLGGARRIAMVLCGANA
jgi:threonine dehydratase